MSLPSPVLDKLAPVNIFILISFMADFNIVTDLINVLPGNCSINTVQEAIVEEAVFSVDPTDAPIDWLDSGHLIICLL
jgi:hypothetical protein